MISALEFGDLPEPAVPVAIDWKLMGADGAARQASVAPANASGLFGERHGWYEPGAARDADAWTAVTLPHTFDGPREWIGWFRTAFDLALPEDIFMPLGLVMDGVAHGGDKALLYLNGYLLGHYWPNRGPQVKFFLPDGILRQGHNDLAIAVWRRHPEQGRLGAVRLEPYDTVALSSLVLEDDVRSRKLNPEKAAVRADAQPLSLVSEGSDGCGTWHGGSCSTSWRCGHR